MRSSPCEASFHTKNDTSFFKMRRFFIFLFSCFHYACAKIGKKNKKNERKSIKAAWGCVKDWEKLSFYEKKYYICSR